MAVEVYDKDGVKQLVPPDSIHGYLAQGFTLQDPNKAQIANTHAPHLLNVPHGTIAPSSESEALESMGITITHPAPTKKAPVKRKPATKPRAKKAT